METTASLPAVILVATLFGLMCAYVAKKTDRNPMLWFPVGILGGIFALVTILYLSNKELRPETPVAVPEKENKNLPHKMWYYLDEDQKQYGPVSSYCVHQELKDKKIDLQTLVWNEDLDDWKKLEDFIGDTTN